VNCLNEATIVWLQQNHAQIKSSWILHTITDILKSVSMLEYFSRKHSSRQVNSFRQNYPVEDHGLLSYLRIIEFGLSIQLC
jgi:hypothetical protein